MYQMPSPKAAMDSCWQKYEFKNNVLVGSQAEWPRGNFFVNDLSAAGVSRSAEGKSLRLSPKGRFRGKSTDSRDIGADISALERTTAEVDR